MLFVALKEGKPKYDRLCFMIRAKAFKAYKDGRWNIHDLFEFNIEKIRNNNYCWYCGQKVEPSKLTKDHVFPRSKGGANEIDNIIMVCKSCNSSKGNMDLFQWYFTIRECWPPVNVSDYPNQINNVLGFPYLFRGALDVRARTINKEMKVAAAQALAALARQPATDDVKALYPDETLEFGTGYIIPKPFDRRLFVEVSYAVAEAAVKSGVAQMEVDLAAYRADLERRNSER